MGATTLELTQPVTVIIYVKIKISFLEKLKSLSIGCVSFFVCWECGIDIFVAEWIGCRNLFVISKEEMFLLNKRMPDLATATSVSFLCLTNKLQWPVFCSHYACIIAKMKFYRFPALSWLTRLSDHLFHDWMLLSNLSSCWCLVAVYLSSLDWWIGATITL